MAHKISGSCGCVRRSWPFDSSVVDCVDDVFSSRACVLSNVLCLHSLFLTLRCRFSKRWVCCASGDVRVCVKAGFSRVLLGGFHRSASFAQTSHLQMSEIVPHLTQR